MGGQVPSIAATDLTWVRWNAAARDAHPEFAAAIDAFDPGEREPAQRAAAWLRGHGLDGEALAYLAMAGDELVGFYALTAGAVELNSNHRKRLGVSHPTQPAILVTWIAKSVRHEIDGALLLDDAIGVAQEAAEKIGASVLALDPFDAPTAELWKTRYKMRESRTVLSSPEDGEPLRRLYLPLRDQSG